MKLNPPALMFAVGLGLAACSTNPAVSDAEQCFAALAFSNSTSLSTLAATALATPACQRLAADALNAIIAQIAAKNAARTHSRVVP